MTNELTLLGSCIVCIFRIFSWDGPWSILLQNIISKWEDSVSFWLQGSKML